MRFPLLTLALCVIFAVSASAEWPAPGSSSTPPDRPMTLLSYCPFEVAGVPRKNIKFVVTFHGSAIDGILDEAHYQAKFGRSNPNLPVLEQFKKAGAELYVCGQNLAFAHMDPRSLSKEVSVAADALIVLMTFQNRGYALLSF